MIRVVSILLALGFAVPAVALDLTPPWPDGDGVKGVEERQVTFPSHSPFSLADVGKAGRDPAQTARGTLYLPKGASAEKPAPAVILLHGAAGSRYSRGPTYARQLASRGVAALVIDVFGPRNDGYSFTERLMHITEAMFLADAYSGLKFLDRLPQVDAKRVALIGFSYGGMVTMYANYAQVAQLYAKEGLRFAGHVSYYAPCIASFRDNRSTGAPLLMLYGGKDEIVDPERCAAVKAELEKGGGSVRIVRYPDAYHQWDGPFAGPYRLGRSLAPCRFVVGRDGVVRSGRGLLPMSNVFVRRIMLGLCSDTKGYLIGRNDAVRAKSNAELAKFLERVLAPKRVD